VSLRSYAGKPTYIEVRDKSPRDFLASWQRVQDEMFQRRDLVGRSGNVDELLSFARGSIFRALLEQVLEDVGDTEDCIAVLGTGQRGVQDVCIGSSRTLKACSSEATSS